MRMRSLFAVMILLLSAFAVAPKHAVASEYGGDLSELTWEQQSEGVTFKNSSGATIDPVAYAKQEGWTCVRLRLLVDGGGGALEQTESYDIALAKRVKAQGMHLILDIFYSNTWADPGAQTTPSEWASQSYSTLKATVQSYTAGVITAFKNAGCLPDYVQIGNEISNGMLWPVGSLSNQSQFVGLIQAGIAGVRQVSSSPQIILHCNNASDTSLVEWFYNTIASQCSYNVVGLSYYPSVGSNMSDLTSAMNTYKGMFGGRPIMIVEFSYWYDYSPPYETTGGGYWTTPTGQQQAVSAMKSMPNSDGVIYWGVSYVSSWGWESLFNTSNDEAEPAYGAL